MGQPTPEKGISTNRWFICGFERWTQSAFAFGSLVGREICKWIGIFWFSICNCNTDWFSLNLQFREKGNLRFHSLQNVQVALNFLRSRKIKVVNIRPDDIVDASPKLTLGLCWLIILHYQVSLMNFYEFREEHKTLFLIQID